MRAAFATIALLGAAVATDGVLAQAWVDYNNESSQRLVADSSVGANDTEEKDYAWADFDQDGDTDLVVVRKEIFSTAGRRRNVLLMNEGIADGHPVNGVLVDHTADLASAATDGGQGMLDQTNDRDVVAVDVNGDGWIDVVTAVTYGDGLPKSISHHRVYINLGEQAGVWQGFRYEEERIPTLADEPDACHVAAGDVTGDGRPDLYFVTYQSNFEDHLLVNVQVDGEWGHFEDQTSARLTSAMVLSDFGTGSWIADMNGDTFNDIVKSEDGPVKIIYNAGDGTFDQFETVSSSAHYFVSVGELNNDGMIDLIISDDGQDRYQLNVGNGGDGMANFSNHSFTYSGGGFDDGFGGNSVTADLNKDGFNDVVVADVDVDAGGCGRRCHVFRNLGNLPTPILQEQQAGGQVVGIPTSMLVGTYDVAVLDLNGDTWLDLVIGRCSGTQIWMNQPPVGIIYQYPGGLPAFIDPLDNTTVVVQLEPVGGGEVNPSTVELQVSIDGGAYVPAPVVALGGNQFEGTFPTADCGTPVQFYFRAELMSGDAFTDPGNAPVSSYSAIAALGTEIVLHDDMENAVTAWTVVDESQPGDTGLWERVEPVPSIFNDDLAAPDEDATPGHVSVNAWVTQNGTEDQIEVPGAADVDGGPFRLVSPNIDLGGENATITFARWVVSEGTGGHVADELLTDISNDDGASWVPVPELATDGTGSAWETVSFVVGDYVEPTGEVRVRFTISDSPNNSVTEAGIDDFSVERIDCGGGNPCPEDVDGNGVVNVEDMVLLILAWGTDDEAADVTGNGIVDVEDLVNLILAWGPCS